MRSNPIAVYGAGGFGREVVWLAEECGRDVDSFLDDRSGGPDHIDDVRRVTFEQRLREGSDFEVVLAVGDPRARMRLARKVEAAGISFAELIHPRVERSRRIRWGKGTVVLPGSLLTTGITVGDHVQIGGHCVIGHDARLGAFATLGPGVRVCGWAFVGVGAYVGAGAVIINGTEGAPLEIGENAVIGAGACVTRSVSAGALAVGVPAKERGAGGSEPRTVRSGSRGGSVV